MSRRFDFFYDFSCPYAYLASTQVEALAERTQSELIAKPVLLGGVFRARQVAQNLAGTLSPAKAKHNVEDLHRWAELFDVPLRFPEGHPNRTVTALRCLLAVGEPFLPLSHRFFAAYWRDGADLSDEAVVRRVLTEAGLDADDVLARAQTAAIKEELWNRTTEGIDAGLFGVPGFVVDGKLYWGQDRMGQVEEALGGEVTRPMPAHAWEGDTVSTDLWFDYSSPFAYLAACRAEELFGAALRWRPMLLGAVFKLVDAPNVPFFAMNDAKRAWITEDVQRQARAANVRLEWPTGFPLRTVLPLRMTLLALEKDRARAALLIRSIFTALWCENQSPEDESLMAELADRAGFDGMALVQEASSPRAKEELREQTSEAVAAGVFGAPGVVVNHPDGSALYWGNDRLELALDYARK